jgi:CheY-like chemotaxis protein
MLRFPAMSHIRKDNNRPTVLVVEDHDDTRFMLKVILEREGYAVLEAEDGLEAVETAAHEQPGLILIDGSLPGLDGISATRRMRQQESLREVPIVALSGHAGLEYEARALAAGCNAYLTKPFEYSQLRDTLNQFLPVYSNAA